MASSAFDQASELFAEGHAASIPRSASMTSTVATEHTESERSASPPPAYSLEADDDYGGVSASMTSLPDPYEDHVTASTASLPDGGQFEFSDPFSSVVPTMTSPYEADDLTLSASFRSQGAESYRAPGLSFSDYPGHLDDPSSAYPPATTATEEAAIAGPSQTELSPTRRLSHSSHCSGLSFVVNSDPLVHAASQPVPPTK